MAFTSVFLFLGIRRSTGRKVKLIILIKAVQRTGKHSVNDHARHYKGAMEEAKRNLKNFIKKMGLLHIL